MDELSKNQRQWLILVIAFLATVSLIAIYILLGSQEPWEEAYILIRQSIPSAVSVLISFIIIYFVFIRRGIDLKGIIDLKDIRNNESTICPAINEIKANLVVDQALRNNGIVKIYHNRQEYLAELNNEINELLKSERKEKEDIGIIGISLREFLNSLHGQNRDLRNSLILRITQEILTVRALILNKSSTQAEVRKKIDEQGLPPGESPLDSDLKNAITFYKKYKATNQCFQLKQYSEVPCTCFMVKFKDYIVVEQYHAGGLGGEIPVLKYKAISDPGVRFKRHFEFIWNHPSTTINAETESGDIGLSPNKAN